jgi:hypothetical protein
MKMVNCLGFRIPKWVYTIIAEANLSVRAATVICLLYRNVPCDTKEELLSNLSKMAAGRLLIRGCGRHAIAEAAEKTAQ